MSDQAKRPGRLVLIPWGQTKAKIGQGGRTAAAALRAEAQAERPNGVLIDPFTRTVTSRFVPRPLWGRFPIPCCTGQELAEAGSLPGSDEEWDARLKRPSFVWRGIGVYSGSVIVLRKFAADFAGDVLFLAGPGDVPKLEEWFAIQTAITALGLRQEREKL